MPRKTLVYLFLCGAIVTIVAQSPCNQPKDSGTSCGYPVVRYYYDRSSSRCRPFQYGGCGGNDNNFQNLETCLQQCNYGCPNGVSFAFCFIPPCSRPVAESCPNYPNARCEGSQCGGCIEKFYDGKRLLTQHQCTGDRRYRPGK